MKFETMLNHIVSCYSDKNHNLTVLFVSTTAIVFSVYMGSGLTNVYKAELSNDSYEIKPILVDEQALCDV